MTEYIDIDNTAPEIKLWQQYTIVEPVRDYFSFFRNYIQSEYYDYLLNNAYKYLSIYNAANDYLQYYALSLFNVNIPIDILFNSTYDVGLKYDVGNKYDISASLGAISTTNYKKVLMWMVNWSTTNWTIPNLYKLIRELTGLTDDEILIEQDDTDLDRIHFSLPDTDGSKLFRLILLYYTDFLKLPFGDSFDIILT